MISYDYARRKGTLTLSWEDFGCLSGQLAEQLAPLRPQAVVGIARAGLFPATAVACALRLDLFPARLTRRQADQVVYAQPTWIVPISPEVAGKTVAIVDEMADSGETLAMAAEAARQLGAAQVLTAALVSHTWAKPAPQFTALTADAFVIFPWDQQVYQDGRWQPHPEIVAGLKAAGLE